MGISVTQAARELKPILNEGRLIIFVGSGVSVDPPSGMPTWDGLIDKYIEFAGNVYCSMPPGRKYEEILEDAQSQKVKYPERVATVLKNMLMELEQNSNNNIEEYFRTWLLNEMGIGQPNVNHKYIVKTNYKYILTSNYDTLLERAVEESDVPNVRSLNLNTYSYNNKDKYDKIASNIYSEKPALIHVHGDIKSIALDEFVFTAEDYIKVVRNYPGFHLMLQILFLKYSVLFVGYGGSDPHLESFIEEIAYFTNWSTLEELPRYYMVLKREKTGAVLNEYKNLLRTTVIEIDDYKEMTSLLRRLYRATPRT